MQPALYLSPAFVVSLTCTTRTLLSIFLLTILLNATAQDSSHIPDKNIEYGHQYPYNKSKVRLVAVANIAAYGTAMAGLYSAWYKDYPQSSFHVFDDWPEWKQMDKLGHVFSAYGQSRFSMELWRMTGINRKKMIWVGGMSGAAYQTVIEVLDGFSRDWGWSWSDFAANVTGSAMVVAQEFAWNEQRIQLKWSFHPKKYDETIKDRSEKLFGNSLAESMLKDYNGQTYWLSTAPASWMKNTSLPQWLQVSVGTGVEGLLGARQNIAYDEEGNVTFSRTDIKRVRQWYLAPDIDLTKIRTKKKGIRLALNVLNVIKFPAPTLEYSSGGVKFHWLYF